jgi:hypothetical protein
MPPSSSTKASDPEIQFDGSNWEDLPRLVTLAKLHRASGTDVDSDTTQSTWVARQCRGPALDWVTDRLTFDPTLFDRFNDFVEQLRQAFGIDDTILINHYRIQLDALAWRNDVPTFLAEFDRLSHACGLGTDTSAKIALLYTKLPAGHRRILAQQNYVPVAYPDLRHRLLTLWTLDPKSPGVKNDKAHARPKCGRCGRRGHTAAECRSPTIKSETT